MSYLKEYEYRQGDTMKISLLILIISLLFISLSMNNANAVNYKQALTGVWKLHKTYDPVKKEMYILNTHYVYQFHEDGTMVLNDVSYRERTYWTWYVEGNRLRMYSKALGIYISGYILQISRDKFVYHIVYRNKKMNYIWHFKKM